MVSRVKIKKGQIEDYISNSTTSYIGDVLIGTIPVDGYNKADWDLANSWGDHAEVGYLTDVSVQDLNTNPNTHDISNIDGKLVSETVTQLNQPYLDGNNLVLKFLNENNVEQTVSVDLSNIITNNSGINNATYNASTNVITLTEEDGDVWDIDLSEFSIITNTDANGVTTLAQENTVKLTVSKVGQTGEYSDLLNVPATISGLSIQDVNGTEQFFTNNFIRFDGVDFDIENQLLSVIQQLLTFNTYTGELSISSGNSVNLDDRYGINPIGRKGEMYYIDENGTNKLVADYPLKRGIVVENQEEFDAATFTGFTLAEVFNHWDMFSHYYGNGEAEQSPPTFPALNESDPQESTRLTADEFYNKTAWGYDSVNDRIYLSKNYHPYTGFISPKSYDDYTLEATFSSPNSDDDWMGLVIGFYKDPLTGFEHTLSVFRMLVEHSGQGNTTYTVEYNHGQNPESHADYNPEYAANSQKIIVDGTTLAPFISGGWNQNTTRVRVVRTGDVFSIKTSQFKSTTIDDTTEIILDLNDHPELSIFKTESKVGFSARSQMDAYFSDIVFTGFTDYIFWPTSETAYDTYEYNQTTQQFELQSPKTTTVTDYFGTSRFIYSYLFEKTYYVTEDDTLIKIGEGNPSYFSETEIRNFFDGTTAIDGYNKTNWDTAFSWGYHGDAGYQTIKNSYRYFGVLTSSHDVIEQAELKIAAGESGYWRINVHSEPSYKPHPQGLPEGFVYSNNGGQARFRFLKLHTFGSVEMEVTDMDGNIWINSKDYTWYGWRKNSASDSYNDLEDTPDSLSDFIDDIGAQYNRVPYTVFIDTLSGDDNLGVIEVKEAPFQTFEAAANALPANDGGVWTFEYLDNVTKTFTSPFPSRDIKITSRRGGKFDFSQVTGDNTAATYLELDIPKSDFHHNGTLESTFGAYQRTFILNCRNINISVPRKGHSGFFIGQPDITEKDSYIHCINFIATTDKPIGFSGEVTIKNTLTIPSTGSFTGNSANEITLNINTITKSGTGSYNLFNGNGNRVSKANIKKINGEGSLTLQSSYARESYYNFEGLEVDPNITLYLNIGLGSDAKVSVTGRFKNNDTKLNIRNSTAIMTFKEFEGRLNSLNTSGIHFKFINTTLRVDGPLIDTNFRELEFINSNTIVQDTPGDLFVNVATPRTFSIAGQLNTSATTFGSNITPIFKTKDLLSDKVDSSALPTFSDDTEATSNGLESGYLYIHQSTGVIKRVGTPLADFATQSDINNVVQDKNYTHTQGAASDTWVIHHNLNKRPSVEAFDSEGRPIWGETVHIDDNTLHILFNHAFSGVANLN